MKVLLISSSAYSIALNELTESGRIKLEKYDLRQKLAGKRGWHRKLAHYFPDRKTLDELRSVIREFEPDVIQMSGGRAEMLLAHRLIPENSKIVLLAERGAIRGINLFSPIEWITYFSSRIDAIVVPSLAMINQWLGNAALRRYICASRLEVAHLPDRLLPASAYKSQQSLRSEYDLPEKTFIVGTVCSLRPIKNLEFLAKIVADLPFPAIFAVVGPIGKKREMARLQQAGGSRLRLIGPIPDARMVMPMFDVYATPTRLPGEASGFATGEAAAAQRPLLTMHFGGASQYLHHGKSGYRLPPIDSDWTEALTRLAHDPVLREEMGRAGRQLMEERHSVDVTCAELEDIYRRRIAAKLRN